MCVKAPSEDSDMMIMTNSVNDIKDNLRNNLHIQVNHCMRGAAARFQALALFALRI